MGGGAERALEPSKTACQRHLKNASGMPTVSGIFFPKVLVQALVCGGRSKNYAWFRFRWHTAGGEHAAPVQDLAAVELLQEVAQPDLSQDGLNLALVLARRGVGVGDLTGQGVREHVRALRQEEEPVAADFLGPAHPALGLCGRAKEKKEEKETQRTREKTEEAQRRHEKVRLEAWGGAYVQQQTTQLHHGDYKKGEN